MTETKGLGDIRSHVADLLARFKTPAHVRLQEEQLERAASSKIYKKGMRDVMIRELKP